MMRSIFGQHRVVYRYHAPETIGAKEIIKMFLMTIVMFACCGAMTWYGIRQIPNHKEVLGRPIVVERGDSNDALLSVMQESAISMIPEMLLDEFEDDGLKISYDDNIAYTLYGPEWSSGVTVFGRFDKKCKGIHINSMYSDKMPSSYVTVHEFGHYLDYKLDWPSDTEEWTEIAREEAPCSVSYSVADPNSEGSYYDRPEEFFAEEFMFYCLNSQGNIFGKVEQNNCPRAQAYIAQLVEDNYR